jgi:hypothetical protein
MIEYQMHLQGNINWIAARDRFRDFLHRKLNIDRSSVIIEGIVSSSDTWYILEGTPALLEALNNMIRAPHNNQENELQFNGVGVALIATIAAAVAVAFIIIL